MKISPQDPHGPSYLLLGVGEGWAPAAALRRHIGTCERGYNIFNPINQYRPDDPLNPINSVDPKNPFNPINRYNPNTPFEPLNRSYRPDR